MRLVKFDEKGKIESVRDTSVNKNNETTDLSLEIQKMIDTAWFYTHFPQSEQWKKDLYDIKQSLSRIEILLKK